MRRRRSSRHRQLAAALPTLALAAWTTACYSAAPYRMPPPGATPSGAEAERVTVELPRGMPLRFQSAGGDTATFVVTLPLTGRVTEVRGDTVVLRDPRAGGAQFQFTPPGRPAVTASTALITPDAHARIAVRQFSGGRTTALVAGVVVVGAMLVAVAFAAAWDSAWSTSGSVARAR